MVQLKLRAKTIQFGNVKEEWRGAVSAEVASSAVGLG
jgi:hypothetical protein